MNYDAFQRLSPAVQVYWTLKHGTYLAQRWESQGGVNLYHCAADEGRGFFVEVGVEDDKPVVLRSFVSAVPLEDYTHYVRLPEW
jgi:hypothetical protein